MSFMVTTSFTLVEYCRHRLVCAIFGTNKFVPTMPYGDPTCPGACRMEVGGRRYIKVNKEINRNNTELR